MTILIKLHKFNGEIFKTNYGITIEVLDGKEPQKVFFDQSNFFDFDHKWIDINKLSDEDFLHQHHIEIIKDEHGNIIPIGLIDFINKSKYNGEQLYLVNYKDENLYKLNQIIKNIEKAIKMKYEAVKFINRFNIDGSVRQEEYILE